MRAEHEVQHKIGKLRDLYRKAKYEQADYYLAEKIACQIDGLAWVLNQSTSADMPTLDERSDA